MRAAPAEAIGARTFSALGTFASLLVADRRGLELAYGLLAGELLAVDMACSRFRPDSELWRVNHAHGHPVGISPLLTQALATALTAARITDGDVDPTCGQSLARLGYDRDFAQTQQDTTDLAAPPAPAAGWQTVELDTERRTVTGARRRHARPGRDGQGAGGRPGRGPDPHRRGLRRPGQPRW